MVAVIDVGLHNAPSTHQRFSASPKYFIMTAFYFDHSTDRLTICTQLLLCMTVMIKLFFEKPEQINGKNYKNPPS